MKTYKVKINGKVYEVELEEVSESSEKIEAPKASSAPVSDGANVVKAPIAGKVLDIKVNVGDVVEIKPDRYLLRHIQHDKNSIRADIPEGHIKEEFGPDYKFPEIEIDGKRYIRIYDQDIDFVIKSYERI